LARAKLTAQKSNVHGIRRLILECSLQDRSKATLPLGASRLKAGSYSYPPDEIVVLTLKHLFGEDLEIDPVVQAWYNEWTDHCKELLEIVSQEDAEIPSLPWQEVLKPYQRVGVKFALASKGCIIGDDRGLGKTLQAISVARALDAKRVLVVAPGYLKNGWRREIEHWTNQFAVVCNGDRAKRESAIELFKDSPETPYLIVNYEMIREKVQSGGYPQLLNMEWDVVLFDEAHRLKGRDSQWVIGAKKLKAKRKYLLTGNPIANRPDEVWQLLNILDPNRFTSYWAFVEYFCNLVDTFFGKEIQGVRKEHLAQLQFTLQPYLIRRLKQEVAPWLPEKIHKVIEVELEGKQKTFYKVAEKHMLLALESGGMEVIETVVEQNIRLQQAIANPAIIGGPDESIVEKTALEMLEDLLEAGEKVIVGLWFVDAVKLFSKKLSQRNIKHFVITGEVKADARDTIVQQFKTLEEPCVLIGGIRAMSEGINADECDHIIFMDKSWTPLDNEQFMDRIHRITSTRTKNYYHIVVKDTVSEDREETLQEKSEMIDEILAMKAVAEKVRKRHESKA